MKLWIATTFAYLATACLFLLVSSNAYLNYYQYILLLPVFAIYVVKLKVEPATDINKHFLTIAYSVALAFCTWAAFWIMMFLYLMAACSMAGNCDL